MHTIFTKKKNISYLVGIAISITGMIILSVSSLITSNLLKGLIATVGIVVNMTGIFLADEIIHRNNDSD